jgi:hypothetical protein
MKKPIDLFKLTLLIIIPLLFSACSVSPWERGNLAKQEMLITPYPSLTSLRNHVLDSKEASAGGSGTVGGGCGCN